MPPPMVPSPPVVRRFFGNVVPGSNRQTPRSSAKRRSSMARSFLSRLVDVCSFRDRRGRCETASCRSRCRCRSAADRSGRPAWPRRPVRSCPDADPAWPRCGSCRRAAADDVQLFDRGAFDPGLVGIETVDGCRSRHRSQAAPSRGELPMGMVNLEVMEPRKEMARFVYGDTRRISNVRNPDFASTRPVYHAGRWLAKRPSRAEGNVRIMDSGPSLQG